MPKISVIMPVYNAERYVGKAIESILNQTYKDFELLIIDDHPLDKTMEIVSKYEDRRLRIIHNDKNRGIAYSRNRGLENAQGEYIALMDDDDIATYRRLEKETEYLDNHPEIQVMTGRYCIINERDEVVKMLPEPLNNPGYIKAILIFYDPIGNGTAMFRKKMIDDNHIRYEDNCYGMEDYRFWIECSKYGKITSLNEVLLKWRITDLTETTKNINHANDQRKKLFAEFKKYALEANQLQVTEDDLKILQIMFPEGEFTRKASLNELKQLNSAMNRIIFYAKTQNLNNAREIEIACKKQFSRRIENSEIWNV